MANTFIVAELGGIAEGRLETTLRQIDAAAGAGVGAVKPQWVSSPQRIVERRNAHGYEGAYERISYPLEWLGVMRDHAKARGLELGCSVYLPEDAAIVAPFVSFLKIASFEACDRTLVGAAFETGRQVIVSLGMGAWPPEGPCRCLHCVSAYPAPMDACNLAILNDPDYGALLDGFSDHTANVLTGMLAVAAGARIVEFHLRLDDTDPSNPDYVCALSPSQAKVYVENIRLAEQAMGDGVKKMQECERDMARYRVKG